MLKEEESKHGKITGSHYFCSQLTYLGSDAYANTRSDCSVIQKKELTVL